MRTSFFFLLLFTYFPNFTFSGQCPTSDSPPIGECQAYQHPSQFCETPIANRTIWVPDGRTQFTMFGDVVPKYGGIIAYSQAVANDIPKFNRLNACFRVLIAVVCLSGYKICQIDNSTGLEFPAPICSSSCQLISDYCQELFQDRPDFAPLFNCSDCPSSDSVVWRNESINGEYVVSEGTVPCTEIIYERYCVYPFTKKPPIVWRDCGVVCPFPTWTTDQWTTIKHTTLGLSIISCIATLVVITAILINPDRRKFPNNLPVYLTISSCGLSISYLIEAGIGFETLWCDDKQTCRFQGWMVMFFMLSVSTWWFSICLNIFLTTIVGISQKARHEKFYHLYAWGFPLFLSLLFVGLDYITYNIGENTCDIIAPVTTQTPWQRIWGYYVPILTQLVIGSILIILIFIRMVQITTDKETFKKLLASQIRILMFLIIFLTIQGFFFSYHINRTIITQEVWSSTLSSTVCKQLDQLNCSNAKNFNYTLFILSIISSAGQGIFFFLLFGTSVSSFKRMASTFRSTMSTNSEIRLRKSSQNAP